MMDLRALEHVNRQAMRKSQRDRKLPALVEAADVDAYRSGDRTALGIPYIGTRVPRGFRVVRSDGDSQAYPLFVDKTGMGSSSEPAWTLNRFLDHLRDNAGAWWGVTEEGPFQVYVQRYERVHKS